MICGGTSTRVLDYLLTTVQYRVIHKTLRVFRPLRYSSRDGHAEGEHVNRGRDKKTWRDSLPIVMLLSAVSVLVVAQPISEFPEGLMNYSVYRKITNKNGVEKKDLDTLGEWAVENGMTINPGKSEAINFTRARVKNPLGYSVGD